MSDWVPFENASYLAEQAFWVSEEDTAVTMEETVVSVYTGRGGKRRLKGSGLVYNELLVQLLDENDDLDLILDFGSEFKYRLITPKMTGGKVFAPNVKSTIQFAPISPWRQIPESEFEELLGKLKFL